LYASHPGAPETDAGSYVVDEDCAVQPSSPWLQPTVDDPVRVIVQPTPPEPQVPGQEPPQEVEELLKYPPLVVPGQPPGEAKILPGWILHEPL
jgi:hypothetical protein